MADFDAKSPAIQLLDLIWSKTNKGKCSKSYRNLNGSMQSALSLAIYSGLEFYEDDFNYINQYFRFGYWGGADNGGFAESFYTSAVYHSNIPACKAFERWKKRKPFITNGVNLRSSSGVSLSSHSRGRLAIGSEFMWNDEQVTVTSFSDDGKQLVACSYTPFEFKNGYCSGGHKPKHIYKINYGDLRKNKA